MLRARDIVAWSVLSGTALGLVLALATPTHMITRTGADWRSQIPRHPDPGDWLRRRTEAAQATGFDYGSPKYDITLANPSDPGADYWANYYAAAGRAQRKAEAANREARKRVEYPPLSADAARMGEAPEREPGPVWEVARDPGPGDMADADEGAEMDEPNSESE